MSNVIITGITSFLTDVSSEMFYPLISLYLVALGSGPEIIGVIEGIAESLASLLKVFSGHISDKIGKRKPLAILGYSSSTIGKVFMFLASSWSGVLLGRITDRFGKGLRTAPRDALIAESVKEKRGAAFGLHRTLDTLGAFTGVLIAIWFMRRYELESIKGSTEVLKNYLPAFKSLLLLSLIPAILGVIVLFFARETGGGKLSKKLVFKWKELPSKLKGFLIVTFIFTLGNSSNQFLLLRAKTIGFSVVSVLLLYLTYNAVYALFSYPAGRLSDRIGRKWIIVIGYLTYGLVYILFSLTKNPLFIYILFGIYGIYMGLTEGVSKALVSDIAPKDLKATLIGLHATLVGIGLFPASLIAGILWQRISPVATFMFGGAMGIIAAIGMMIVL